MNLIGKAANTKSAKTFQPRYIVRTSPSTDQKSKPPTRNKDSIVNPDIRIPACMRNGGVPESPRRTALRKHNDTVHETEHTQGSDEQVQRPPGPLVVHSNDSDQL